MRENLHFVVVGHVDHGKSTLIGRLLYDTNSLPPDKMEEVRQASRLHEGQPEFAFVMDHLEEERNQRITIDTAQIFFKTALRDYVIIDAPGHKQFLKNMITGATQAEAALLLVDAAEGLREQTHRHAYMLSLLGLKQIVVVINKLDLVGYQQARFEQVSGEITARLDEFGLTARMVLPISARLGDNVALRSERLDWYGGPTLLSALDTLECAPGRSEGPCRFPVQDVYDVDGVRIAVGRVASGQITAGQSVALAPDGTSATVDHVRVLEGRRENAVAGESVGVGLREATASEALRRGLVLAAVDDVPRVANSLEATVFWMSDEPLRRGEQIAFKCATQQVACTVAGIYDRLDSSSLKRIADDSEALEATEVARLRLELDGPVCVDAFERVAETGQFVLMRRSNTVAGGIVA